MSSGVPANIGGEDRHLSARGRVARYVAPTARILMGLIFCLTGLNGFLRFLPEPDPATIPAGAGAFAAALVNTGYMFQLISGTQLLVGLLLVFNRFVPLALVLIAPVIVNIIAFHLFLAPAGIVPGLVVLALEIYLIWAYRHAYRVIFTPRVTPNQR